MNLDLRPTRVHEHENLRGEQATPLFENLHDLLFYAALLSGLGARAGRLVGALATGVNTRPAAGRTCIDAGSPLLFALTAPGERQLRLLSRSPDSSRKKISWRRQVYSRAGDGEAWQVMNFLGEPEAAWALAEGAAGRVPGGRERLRQAHAALGPLGRIYSISWPMEASLARATVSWQVDRGVPLQLALEACGAPGIWKAAAPLWEGLLGYPPSLRTGPWSIQLSLESCARLQLGSTNWARRVEDEEKRRRMAALVERFGGDRSYAEALYKLLLDQRTSSRAPHVGRAVEVEFKDEEPVSMEFFLSVP